MPDKFYTLPFPFQNIIERKEVPMCDLKTSIAQKIHLTLTTFFGESRFNINFGCEIWEFDFENIANINAWKDRVTKSITNTITENEKRLDRVKVAVDIRAEEFSGKPVNMVTSIRKRLDMRVTGNLLKTNEPFYYEEPIYISPISMD